MRAAPNARMHMARVTTRHGAAMGTALVSFQNYADAQAFAHSAQAYGLFLPFPIHSSLGLLVARMLQDADGVGRVCLRTRPLAPFCYLRTHTDP